MNPSRDRVTVKDVAKFANVSIATVSRVLNGNYYVSPEIADRVNAAIKELQYYPNSVARSLKTRSTKTIGFVVSDISNSYHITLAKAVEDVISVEGYNMIVCSTKGSKERELTYLQLLQSKNFDGLLLNSTAENNDYIASLNMPMILINRKLKIPNFIGDIIDTDNFQGSYLLTKQLLQLGHRKIFVIKGPKNLNNAFERMQGFISAMKEYGIVVDDQYPFQFEGNFTLKSGYEAVEQIGSMEEKPTAIIALNNMMSVGALKCMKEKNINAPEDLSIVSYDGIDNLELMSTRPSTAQFHPYEIGRCAGEAILQRIENPNMENRTFIFPPTMVAGNAVSIPTDNLSQKATW